MAKDPKSAAKQIVTIRFEDELIQKIDAFGAKIQAQREAGAGDVTRTEALRILVEYGLKHLSDKPGKR